MSRIRSIHPGQWTDEDFVECSPFARLLTLGVRNEADDNGIFEWRATRLKMRIFPADAIDVGELLDELEARGLVLRFEAGGRLYGAIRNFRVYQNPRSPKTEHPITPEAERFVGVRAGEDAEPKRGPGRPRKQHPGETKLAQLKSIPQSAENNSLMERERREEENSPSDSSIGKPTDLPPTALMLVSEEAKADDVAEAFRQFESLRAEFYPAGRTLALDRDRRKKIAARLREAGGLPGWARAMATIRGSPFLRGEKGDWPFVTITFLLSPTSFRRILEGEFNDDRNPSSAGKHTAVRRGPIDALGIAIAASGLG